MKKIQIGNREKQSKIKLKRNKIKGDLRIKDLLNYQI